MIPGGFFGFFSFFSLGLTSLGAGGGRSLRGRPRGRLTATSGSGAFGAFGAFEGSMTCLSSDFTHLWKSLNARGKMWKFRISIDIDEPRVGQEGLCS